MCFFKKAWTVFASCKTSFLSAEKHALDQRVWDRGTVQGHKFFLASFAAYFHVTLDQLILHDLKAEGFTADSDPSSVMMESKTPYMQGIEKNTGNYIYLTEEELNLILAFRSSSDEQRKIVTGFLNSDK